MDKIKIVHILHSVGGVDTSLRMILENIDATKFESVIIHGTKDNSDFYDNTNTRLREYFLPIERDISLLKDLKSIVEARKIIKREKPDIIHAHSAKGGVIGNVIGRFVKDTTVFHTPQAYSFLSAESSLKRKLYVLIERLVKGKNSVLLASSNSELERGLNEINYEKENTVLFDNCIAPIQLDPNYGDISNYNLPEHYICTVGRPSFQKNIEMMVEVIKEAKTQIPNIHLVIMGIGVVSPNTENVKRLIKSYGLESNTTLIEWTERERIFHIVDRAKFYISTARYEGLPYAIIEALSLSKAIIASDCDGNKDLVVDGYNGFLINQDDVKTFSDKVVTLYNSDKLRTTQEQNSHKLFMEKFNLNNNIQKLEQIYLDFA